MGSTVNHPSTDNPREPATHRPRPIEVGYDLGDCSAQSFGSRRLGSEKAEAIPYEVSRCRIYDSSLDSSATDIDSENLHLSISHAILCTEKEQDENAHDIPLQDFRNLYCWNCRPGKLVCNR